MFGSSTLAKLAKEEICPTHLSLGGNRSPVGSPVTVEEPGYGHHILPCAGDSTRHQVSSGGSGRELPVGYVSS